MASKKKGHKKATKKFKGYKKSGWKRNQKGKKVKA